MHKSFVRYNALYTTKYSSGSFRRGHSEHCHGAKPVYIGTLHCFYAMIIVVGVIVAVADVVTLILSLFVNVVVMIMACNIAICLARKEI